ncbi:T9SS C-terminal target domain-containing protein [Mariniflexile sp. HNIBRBA6329]|uniref:T9SS C-terminal target domain-containing protein n=1 Tax=Mariniflexile sp. HNIBRBA6329 TaxID=3373088 RepID=UPI003745E18F
MKVIKIRMFKIFLAVFVVMNIQCNSQDTKNQKQTLKVDFDFSGRRFEEVHDTDYEVWVVEEKQNDEKSFGELTVKLKGNFTSKWFKVGMQAPHYNKLGSDGLVTDSSLEFTISGLKPGKHSLLTYHNSFDVVKNKKTSPIKIYVNNELVETVQPSNRAFAKIEIATAYIIINVDSGKDVKLRFETDTNTENYLPQLVLNGFEIDTPNIKKQANTAFPESGDEHVVVNGKLKLAWEAPNGIKEHMLYFGENQDDVAAATENSKEFKGKLSETSYEVENLYSMITYYWRVDEIDEDGTITKGDVWSFKPAQLAFKGAEGYGRFAVGGRGGKVVEVTNLNDDGPGSLRDAVNQEIGPRTIVFNVSGNIELKSRLVASQPYITIAGQTAPGEGITVTRAPIGITGNDCVARFLKVRIGSGTTFDGMGLTGANHSIIDHSSICWTIDESFSSRGAHHITLQRTFISEALNVAGHDKYEAGKMHGYAATIGGDIGSFHHNLLAHNYGRNWSMGGGLNGDGYYSGRLDIRNNVVYNWGNRTTDGGANEVNFVNNYYKPGPSTDLFFALTADHEGVGKGSQRYFFDGNVMPGHFDIDTQEKGRRSKIKNNENVDYETFVDEPFFESYVTTQTAKAAYKNVLSDVGANQPFADKRDIRIIEETLNGTYKFKGSKSGFPGMIDTEADAGGFPEFKSETRPAVWDTDHDGLPNWWEQAHGLNENSKVGDFSDANSDEDKDGFTQLDDYLDWMAQPHYFVNLGDQLELALIDYFRGYKLNPVYSFSEVKNGNVSLNKGKLQFRTDKKGLASFVIRVIDDEGDTMSRTVNVYVK